MCEVWFNDPPKPIKVINGTIMANLLCTQIRKLSGFLLEDGQLNCKRDSAASSEPKNNAVGTQTPPEFAPSDYESQYGKPITFLES